ncbi:MAG: CoA-binding protein [Acidobacteria bacterium]|nr:CoA-binding protein [Acidobacteriota bacterium]
MLAVNTRAEIDDFLAQMRLAVVGVSRDPREFSRRLLRELIERGYDAVPVNPYVGEMEGRRCFCRLQEITPPVQAALLMTAPEKTEQVVRDCVAAGITRIWLHRGAGRGAVSAAAVDFCRDNDLHLVAGFCPYMFLPEAGWFHRVHAWFRTRGPMRFSKV